MIASPIARPPSPLRVFPHVSPPKNKKGHRRKSELRRAAERERRLAAIREQMITRLDRSALAGPFAETIGWFEQMLTIAGLDAKDVRAASLKLIQDLQLSFFPEEFLDDDEIAGRIQGLVPKLSHATVFEPAGEAALLKMLSGKGLAKAPPLKPLAKYPNK